MNLNFIGWKFFKDLFEEKFVYSNLKQKKLHGEMGERLFYVQQHF